jgi:multidrug transporter EmrE-like cation transporter
MSATGFVLLLITAALTMAANLLLRKGIDAAGGFAFGVTELLPALLRLFLQPLFALGFVTYFLASVVWFRVVATESLSLAYPILVSLTFALVTGGAVVLFSEPLSVRKLIGLAVILTGIGIISLEKGAK